MHTTSTSSSRAPSRRRRAPVVEQYDDSSSQEEEDDDDDDDAEESSEEGSSSSEGDSAEDSNDSDNETPQARRPTLNLGRPKSTNLANTSSRRCPPPRTLNTTTSVNTPTPNYNARTSSRAKVRKQRPSSSTAGGSSIPSYEDTTPSPSYFSPNNYSYLPAPPSTRQQSQQQQQQQHPEQQQQNPWSSQLSPPLPKPHVRSRRPHRPRTNTVPPNLDQSAGYSSSSTTSSSSTGPWQSLPAPPVPLKRNKTVREPVGAPVQAIVPRAPRTVAAARIDEEYEDEDDVDEIARVVPNMREPAAQARNMVAGGKKAALAVELKMNLEIELELKAYIHGDVTLELFN